MVTAIARFIVDKSDWLEFQKSAKEVGFLSGSECLRSRVRDVNNTVKNRNEAH